MKTSVLYKAVVIILAYFMPVGPLIIATVVFCLSDFITGVCYAARSKSFTSKKAKHKAWDLFFYIGAIVLSYIFYSLFRSYFDFPLHKVTAFIILSIEFWSNMENISKLTGVPLLSKNKFFEYVDKLKNLHSTDTNKKDKGNEN